MKRKFSTGKRALALALAATMLVGDASVVSAAKNTDVSKAADGSVSKVIGLKETSISSNSYGYDYALTNEKGDVFPYYYINTYSNVSNKVKVAGNVLYTVDANGNKCYSGTRKDGFYYYNGVSYGKATYDKNEDYTLFEDPVSEVLVKERYLYGEDWEKIIDPVTKLISLNGKLYKDNVSTSEVAYFINSGAEDYAPGNYAYKIVDGKSNYDAMKDKATGLYLYNGNYYRYAYYVDNRDNFHKNYNNSTGQYYTYTNFTNKVGITDNIEDLKVDTDGDGKKDEDLYGYWGATDDGRYYYELSSEHTYALNYSTLLDNEGRVKREENGLYKYGNQYFKDAYCESGKYVVFYNAVTFLYDTENDYTDISGCYNKDYKRYYYNGAYRALYKITYYRHYINANQGMTLLGVYDSYYKAYDGAQVYEKNADGTEVDRNRSNQPTYYEVNGNAYSDTSIDYIDVEGERKCMMFVRDTYMIAFGNKMTPQFSWQSLGSYRNNRMDDNGVEYKAGYEIMLDDQLITASNYLAVSSVVPMTSDQGPRMICTSNSISGWRKLAEGESVKLQVRGVYYVVENQAFPETTAEDKYVKKTYRVVKTGEWSDPYVYTRAATNIGKINDLTASINGTKAKLSWTPMADAKGAIVYQIDSTVPLEITPENAYSYIDGKVSTNYYRVHSFDIYPYKSSSSRSIYEDTSSYFDMDAKKTVSGYSYAIFKYHYYVAKLTYACKGKTIDKSYSNVASIEYMAEPNVPAVEGLKLEYSTSGAFNVAWKAKDSNAKVVVYAYEKKDLPKYFNYKELNARSKVITSIKHFDESKTRVELTEEVFDKLVKGKYFYLSGADENEDSKRGGVVAYQSSTAYKKDGKFYKDYNCTLEIDKKYVYVSAGNYTLNDDTRVSITWDNAAAKNYVVDITKWSTREEVNNTRSSTLLETALSTYCPDELNNAKAVYKATADINTGYVSSSSFTNGFDEKLKTGKTYYFVAYTYDSLDYDTEKASVASIDGMEFTYYNAFSAPSKVVSSKKNIGKPNVLTKVGKNSIKLTMYDSDATGFIIYRKSGKGKYKKLTTICDSVYVDKNLKQGKEYTYKVVAYNYDRKLKIKTVSKEYTVVSATPSIYNKFNVKATVNSKNSIKLTWTKLAKAKKYEIYRLDTDGDYNTQYSSNSLPGEKWKLIKTIKKAKTTSYVDKNLIENGSYSYIVVAYYKNKKKMCRIAKNVEALTLLSVTNISSTQKGSSAKITWDANKAAKGFEVEYTIYNMYGRSFTHVNVAKTTKNSFVINGIPENGFAYYKVRAYAKNVYSEYTTTLSTKPSLDVAKNITAKYDSSKKAVRISWKPVAGAAYYKVYRSNFKPQYHENAKKYIASGKNISAEANDDEKNDAAYYRQYRNEVGTIVDTTAYDYYILDSDVKYYYTVVAYGENGKVYSGLMYNNSLRTASSKPAEVVFNKTKVTISKVSKAKKGAKISFKKIANAQKIILLRATKKNGKYSVVAKANGKATSIIDKKAKKGKTYFYKLRVVKTNGLLAETIITSAAKKCKIK